MERLFCENCGSLCEESPCPVCGGKKLRAPKADDLCLLTEQSQLFSGMLADVLRGEEVPFLQKGRLGAGLAMSVGLNLESYSFYVPYSDFPRAEEIVTALFHPDRTLDGEDEDGDSPDAEQSEENEPKDAGEAECLCGEDVPEDIGEDERISGEDMSADTAEDDGKNPEGSAEEQD